VYAGFLCISLGIVFWDVPRVPKFPPRFLDELVTRFCNLKFIHMWSRDDLFEQICPREEEKYVSASRVCL
jgi:hypothetical protein